MRYTKHLRYDARVPGRIALIVVALVAHAAPARADDSARLLLDGLERMRAGDFQEALDRFERAYVLSRDPRLLAHAAEAYAELGRCAAARTLYQTFEQLAPGEPAPPAGGALARCLSPAEPPEPEPPAPPEDALELMPPGPPPADEPTPRLRLAGLVTIGGGLALGGVGLYFGWRAQRASDDVSRLYDLGGTWDAHFQDVERRGQRDSTVSRVLLGIGGAAVVGGVTMLLIDTGDSVASARPVDGGAELVWTCAF